MRAFALAAVLLLAGTAVAATTYSTTSLGAGQDWLGLKLSPGVACADVQVFWNWTAGSRPANHAAFWLVGRGGGFREAAAGVYWDEADAGVRATVTDTSGTVASVGPVGNFLATRTGGRATFNGVCAGSPVVWDRIAFAVPHAKNATLKVALGGTTTVTPLAGSGAYGHSDSDLTGVRADVALTGIAGASAARDVKLVKTLPKGTVNAFVSTDQATVLESFRGTSPTSPPPGDTYGDNIAACTGSYALVVTTCRRLAGPTLWPALGEGNATRAPAGTYTFRINNEAGAEPVHVAVVGAPVDW